MSLIPKLHPYDKRIAMAWVWMLALISVMLFSVSCSLSMLQENINERRVSGGMNHQAQPTVIGRRELETRVENQPNDVNAWMAYAEFVSKAPAPGNAHLQDAMDAWQRCTEISPDNAEMWFRYGTTCRAAGRMDNALQAAKRACRVNPNDHRYVALQASILLDVENIVEAEKLLDSVADEDRSQWQYVLLRVRGLLQGASSPEQLFAEVEEARLQNPNETELQGVLAYVAWVNGERERGKELLRESSEKLEGGSLEYLRFVAAQANAMGLDDLIQKVHRVTAESQLDPYLSLQAARQSWRSGKPQEVIENLQWRTLSLVTDSEACLLFGLSLQATGNQTRLTSLLKDLELQHSSSNSSPWYDLIQLLVEKKRTTPQEVAEATRKVREVAPNSSLVTYVQASAFFLMGEYEVAGRYAAEATRQSPRWELPQYLLLNSTLLMGKPCEALEIARRTVTQFPNQFAAVSGYAFTQAILLPMAETEHAERLQNWAFSVQLPENDPWIPEIALIRALAEKRLGNIEKATELQEQFLPQWKSLSLSDLIRVMALRRQNVIASGERPSNTFATSSLNSASGRSTQSLVGATTDVATEKSIEGAAGWRIAKARKLLIESDSASDSASAALVLRPVVNAMPEHADARLLMGIAMLRLHDHSAGYDHFLAVLSRKPENLGQVLRLSLGCREAGHWPDAHQFADFWVAAVRTAATRANVQQERVTGKNSEELAEATEAISHLQVLVAYAEQSNDEPLAIAAYRRWLRVEPENPIACNNLAYLIYQQADSIEEAIDLSSRAIRQAPENVEFQQTMMSIEKHYSKLNTPKSKLVIDSKQAQPDLEK